MVRTAAVLSLLAFAGAAQAQHFVNGDFATGDFTGWTITLTPNGVTRVQDVVQFAIVPNEPAVNCGYFCVAQETTGTGEQGIEMTQPMQLTAGVPYDFGFNWAAIRYSGGVNSEGGVFSLIVDGVALATQNAGDTSSTLWKYGRIDAQFIPAVTGQHIVGVRITRPFTASLGGTVALNLRQLVSNFTPNQPPIPPCYADCDGNEALNVDDFLCFINEFATAQSLPTSQQITHYANCDGSTAEPVLTVDDFLCFINEFAQGCP
jgi:hypothetical protein